MTTSVLYLKNVATEGNTSKEKMIELFNLQKKLFSIQLKTIDEINGEGDSIGKKPLKMEDLLTMIRDFRGSQQAKPGKTNEISRSCWFPRALFEKMLLDENVDGLRMYFAIHSDKTTNNADYIGCQTLIVCPTIRKNDSAENVLIPGFVSETLPSSDLSGNAEDGGSLCPPPSTGGCPGCTLMHAADGDANALIPAA